MESDRSRVSQTPVRGQHLLPVLPSEAKHLIACPGVQGATCPRPVPVPSHGQGSIPQAPRAGFASRQDLALVLARSQRGWKDLKKQPPNPLPPLLQSLLAHPTLGWRWPRCQGPHVSWRRRPANSRAALCKAHIAAWIAVLLAQAPCKKESSACLLLT